jgi:hypothetical protein
MFEESANYASVEPNYVSGEPAYPACSKDLNFSNNYCIFNSQTFPIRGNCPHGNWEYESNVQKTGKEGCYVLQPPRMQ